MAGFFKLLSWLFIIAVSGYILYGFSTAGGASGKAIEMRQISGAEVLSLPECTDMDGGKNYGVPASTFKDNLVYDDYCEDEGVLAEYFCNNGYPDRIFIKCDCYMGYCRS